MTCLVTGASRGIGLAIARRFANLQATVILVGRHENTLKEAAHQCHPFRAGYVVGNVRDREFWEDFTREGRETKVSVSEAMHSNGFGFREPMRSDTSAKNTEPAESKETDNPLNKPELFEDKYGFAKFLEIPKPSDRSIPHRDVNVLVNAAGKTHSSLLMTTKPDLVEEVVQTNLMGTLWGCRSVGKMMVRNKRAGKNIPYNKYINPCIINIASLLGTHGGRGAAAYAASKAGVLGLTRALAAELGPSGVRVNAIVPGYVDTSMTEAMDPMAREAAKRKIPLNRLGTVEEVADAAVFLAANQYANNCILNLDGGLSASM